jgi:hypothetical protein
VRHACVWPVLMTCWAETSVTENTEAMLDAENINLKDLRDVTRMHEGFMIKSM